VIPCWFPGLFLVNDFTVPGAAMKQGRRQEPCITTNHPLPTGSIRNGPSLHWRRPPLIHDSKEGNSKTPSSVSSLRNAERNSSAHKSTLREA